MTHLTTCLKPRAALARAAALGDGRLATVAAGAHIRRTRRWANVVNTGCCAFAALAAAIVAGDENRLIVRRHAARLRAAHRLVSLVSCLAFVSHITDVSI